MAPPGRQVWYGDLRTRRKASMSLKARDVRVLRDVYHRNGSIRPAGNPELGMRFQVAPELFASLLT